jgi:light-regulated signal transduction histidine kinase (bacteriophytochrome)
MTDQDPTRMAALEAELASLRNEMQDFSYTVSHDLRANLRHILSYAQLVREDAGHLLPQETLGFLDTITDSARHMGVQMDGLMELTRLGTVALQREPLPLLPLVQDVVGELQMQYPQRQIEWLLAAEMPAVLADASLLRLALHAVLDNAVKFTAHRPIAQISILAGPGDAADAGRPSNGVVRLTVQDDGVGFNPALGAKLFHAFARLHTSKQFPGIGMGLALTRKIVDRLHGTVQAQGVAGGGCSVAITLPAAHPPH